MRAKFSILGMYNYDPTVFDELVVPEGVSRSTLIHTILYKCADLSLVYTEPETLAEIIGLWSMDRAENWRRMALALTEEYNPLHNYDRTEEWSESEAASGATSGKETSATVKPATVEQRGKVAGFDVNSQAAMVPNSETETVSDAGSLETVRSASDKTQRDNLRKGRAYGNIGVTTSMQMLREEVAGRQKYALYDIIADDFKREFCICIY